MFGQLIEIAGTIGHTENEQRELESKNETLKAKITERNMGKIREDIRAVQAENAAMNAKLTGAAL